MPKILPDLTFPMLTYGARVTPSDLRPLLYKGGAEALVDEVTSLFDKGKLGSPIADRLPLVKKIHEHLTAKLVGGGSRQSFRKSIYHLRTIFAWADKSDHVLNLSNAKETYLQWADYLWNRVKVIKDLKMKTAYGYALSVGAVLDAALEREVKLISQTRLKKTRTRKSGRGVEADKQNLEQTFAFGHALLDICDALPVDVIWGPSPVQIPFRTGVTLEDWGLSSPPGKVTASNAKTPQQRSNLKRSERARKAYQEDRTLRTRWPLVNLRIQAEMLMFIGQTGMNLSEVHAIKTGKFHYAGHLGGYQVRRHKNRRGGDVEFEVFSEYKEVFERYLDWRDAIFPDNPDGLMFPLIRTGGRAEDTAPKFHKLQGMCKVLKLRFIPPRQLRNTRVNWLLRRSRDEDLTAEMSQHSKETLLRNYAEPNLQVTMAEVARYHNKTDPAIAPPGPGWCVKIKPEAVPDMPKEATPPDCVSGAGCLFCKQQRDIDSQDHTWSLASFRHLKSLELAKYRPPAPRRSPQPLHPAAAAVDRITAKLKFFESSSAVRKLWVREALDRVAEEDFHPLWNGFIQLQEARA